LRNTNIEQVSTVNITAQKYLAIKGEKDGRYKQMHYVILNITEATNYVEDKHISKQGTENTSMTSDKIKTTQTLESTSGIQKMNTKNIENIGILKFSSKRRN
jgi:hypothetical protein